MAFYLVAKPIAKFFIQRKRRKQLQQQLQPPTITHTHTAFLNKEWNENAQKINVINALIIHTIFASIYAIISLIHPFIHSFENKITMWCSLSCCSLFFLYIHRFSLKPSKCTLYSYRTSACSQSLNRFRRNHSNMEIRINCCFSLTLALSLALRYCYFTLSIPNETIIQLFQWECHRHFWWVL